MANKMNITTEINLTAQEVTNIIGAWADEKFKGETASVKYNCIYDPLLDGCRLLGVKIKFEKEGMK